MLRLASFFLPPELLSKKVKKSPGCSARKAPFTCWLTWVVLLDLRRLLMALEQPSPASSGAFLLALLSVMTEMERATCLAGEALLGRRKTCSGRPVRLRSKPLALTAWNEELLRVLFILGWIELPELPAVTVPGTPVFRAISPASIFFWVGGGGELERKSQLKTPGLIKMLQQQRGAWDPVTVPLSWRLTLSSPYTRESGAAKPLVGW